MLRWKSDQHEDIPDDTRLFVFVVGDEVKRTEYFVKEPMGLCWQLGENIEL
jgi:hypothetical protein